MDLGRGIGNHYGVWNGQRQGRVGRLAEIFQILLHVVLCTNVNILSRFTYALLIVTTDFLYVKFIGYRTIKKGTVSIKQ